MRANGLHAQGFQAAFIHHHDTRGAIANLAGIGRGDDAAFLQELHALNAFQGGVSADAFVGGVHLARGMAFGVEHGHRQDFVL